MLNFNVSEHPVAEIDGVNVEQGGGLCFTETEMLLGLCLSTQHFLCSSAHVSCG